MPTNKEICGHCENLDLWCGICLDPESERFKNEQEEIFELEACEHFKLENSYINDRIKKE